MKSKLELLAIANHCEKIISGDIKPVKNMGLCYELCIRFDIVLCEYINFSEWIHSSGDDMYPIKAPDDFIYTDEDTLKHRVYFNRMSGNCFNMWDINTTYGKQRLLFTGWIVERLRELAED